MPNTQTSVPLYAQGEVLTAANLNLTNSGIPVFATTVTRDAAFGGANEKVLAEGQFAYIEATNTTQYYDGAAWQSVGVAPGLVRITGATFSAVSSITVDNCFSATYTSYKVIFNYFTSSTGSVTAQFRVGGVAAATNYNAQDFTASSTSLSGSRSTGNTSFLFAPEVNGSFYSLAEWSLVGVALAQPTNMISAMNRNNGSYANPTAIIFNYVHTTATAYDGIAWTAASGTMTGSYQIYGYAIS